MPKPFKIVYPDADPSEEKDYQHLFDRLRQVADLSIFKSKPDSDEEYKARIENADGILLGWDLPNAVMSSAQNLKVVSFLGIGVRQFVDCEAATQRSITVCNCPGYADTAVAEHTLALLLGCSKKIPAMHTDMQQGRWSSGAPMTELKGKTIGLIGFGGIGKQVARLCSAFGLKVLVWTRSMNSQLEVDYDIELCELDDLYQRSDIISLHVAETEQTKAMIETRAFEKMRDGIILINTARAQLIDESALKEALDTGKIASAGLDVYYNEPLTPGHYLLNRNNVILSPHVAFNTPETSKELVAIGINNLIEYIKGNPINNVN